MDLLFYRNFNRWETLYHASGRFDFHARAYFIRCAFGLCAFATYGLHSPLHATSLFMMGTPMSAAYGVLSAYAPSAHTAFFCDKYLPLFFQNKVNGGSFFIDVIRMCNARE